MLVSCPDPALSLKSLRVRVLSLQEKNTAQSVARHHVLYYMYIYARI